MNSAELANQTKSRVKFAKNWEVIFYNDDTTSLEFVVIVLVEVFKYDFKNAFLMTKQVEAQGSSVVAVLPKKLASVRVEKVLELASEGGYKDFKVEMKEED